MISVHYYYNAHTVTVCVQLYCSVVNNKVEIFHCVLLLAQRFAVGNVK